jgi:hypothetical protein
MTDITNSINNAINIVEKRINFQEKEANEPYMLELYGELLRANTALIYRKNIEKKLANFDCFGKDKVFANTVWELNT